MEKVGIEFKGMTNVPDFSGDGDMAVLLNMRHKGGELVQVQPPTEEEHDTDESVEQALYHAQSGKWLELDKKGTLIVRREGSFTQDKYKSFAIMGNVVVMYGEDFVHYAIWRNGGYVFLGELPEVPMLRASNLQEQTIKRQTDEEYYTRYDAEKKLLYNRTVQKGFVDEILSSIYEKCGYIDRAWFRVGLKLFDGSYIAVSGIYQLSARRTGQDDIIGIQVENMWYESTTTGGGNEHYTAQVNYFVPEISVNSLQSGWKDIIVSIDVFSTGSIMSHVAAVERGERSGNLFTDQYEWYRKRSAEELKEAMLEAEFYKVAEYSIDGELLWEIDNTSPSNIAVQQQLKDVQVHCVVPLKSLALNSRLHAAGVTDVYFNGYAPAYKYDSRAYGRVDGVWTVVVYIDTGNGEKIVKYREPDVQLPDLLYYFVYPDSRATKMEIYREGTEGLEVLQLPLIAHRHRNEAYFLKTALKSATVQEEDGEIYYTNIPVIDTDLDWESADTIPDADKTDISTNILKVSAVDNPFYFPAAQTYKFEGEIRGIASNAEAVSTGQFGQYPLFVFTKEGIWAMAVDTSGQGAYVSQSPFSREVCIGEVCPVSGGIVFATERGLMAISGGQVSELSAQLDGLDFELWQYNEGLWEAIYSQAEYINYIAPKSIREYIKGAKLGYNYLHNEVILSNSSMEYSYVYSLTNGTWSIIDRVFDLTTNSYPKLVVYNNDKRKRYTFEDCTSENNIVAITRPVKVGTTEYKRLRQAALRCLFEGGLNFYLLGSNDGADFVCITGKENEYTSNTQRDMVTAMSRSKQYKYLAIAIAGTMRGKISFAELLVDGSFSGNKLR